jgi:RimJ/RimL family protein N-acetyltransferase
VGIDIAEDAHLGAGLGSAALWLWTDYLFDSAPIMRLGLHTYSFNHRMRRAAVKVGYVDEGAVRAARRWQGTWIDRHAFGMLRTEWEALRARRA